MDSRVGTILREARRRRKVDLQEVEAVTRIRARYLRAIEDGEWDALPGGVYTRGFIRTYASFLGLDGERLADDYRREAEGDGGGAPISASAPAPRRRGGRRRAVPPSGWVAVGGVVLVAALAISLLPEGGGEEGGSSQQPSSRGEKQSHEPTDARAARDGASVRLATSAEVWVCMLDAKGRRLIDGQILAAGAEEGPFHSGSFTVSFGNGEVTMVIDGKQADIPPTSSPIGFSIDAAGRLTQLDEAERPTCV